MTCVRIAAAGWLAVILPACGGGGNANPQDGASPTDAAPETARPSDAVLSDGARETGAPPPATPGCPALPAPTGTTMMVTPAMDLAAAVSGAAAGTTLLLADGTYTLGGIVPIRKAGLTIRSASGDATKVIVDGAYTSPEIFAITANNVTLAHLTITRAVDHPVHVYPDATNVTGTRLYGLRVIDGGEQFVKVNPDAARSLYVDDGRVECSLFQMTATGRTHVESLGSTSCYTGGIDVHGGRGWVVSQNRFEDIYCTNGKLAEHAVHFWSAARDTLVEDNVIINCARGIGFGLIEAGESRAYADNPYPGVGYVGHFDGIIRNNTIFADVPAFDTGIELAQARGTRVYHNTVFAGPSATGFFSSIDYRFANTKIDLRNNLVGRITVRGGATATTGNNKEGVASSDFKDPAAGDLHLLTGAADAIDQGAVLPEAGLDIDGQAHNLGAAPDLGADEIR